MASSVLDHLRVPPAQRAIRALRRRVDGTYGGTYFGDGRDATTRGGLSGYERYDRATSNADFAAWVIWRHFPVQRTLEVGCALGYLVEALRELGLDARGVDVSRWAVHHATPAARDHVARADVVRKLPAGWRGADLVIALEVLEHLPPALVPKALAELRRATTGWVYCTIPSFGPNAHGADGFFEGKVRPERVEHYKSLGPDYRGPVPPDDLEIDARGEPIEGHLCIASYEWWTERFAEAGLERCGEVEVRLNHDLWELGFTGLWNTYVFRVPGTPIPTGPVRHPALAAAVRRRWRLDERRPTPR